MNRKGLGLVVILLGILLAGGILYYKFHKSIEPQIAFLNIATTTELIANVPQTLYGCNAYPGDIILHAKHDYSFFADDGTYVYWFHSDHQCLYILQGADPKTFKYLGYYYGEDKNAVYYRTGIIEGADSGTFEFYDNFSWAKDKNNVYYHGYVVEGADASTFSMVPDSVFTKDKKRVYYDADNASMIGSRPNIAKGIDGASFGRIGSSTYFEDKNSVYLSDDEALMPLTGSDPSSFTIVGECASVEMSSAEYSKDATHVWCGTNIIKNADPVTFQIVGYNNSLDGEMPYSEGIAKDKNCIYRAGVPLVDAQGKCYDPTNCLSPTISTMCNLGKPYQKDWD